MGCSSCGGGRTFTRPNAPVTHPPVQAGQNIKIASGGAGFVKVTSPNTPVNAAPKTATAAKRTQV